MGRLAAGAVFGIALALSPTPAMAQPGGIIASENRRPGTTDWLITTRDDPRVQRITANLLARITGRTAPATAGDRP